MKITIESTSRIVELASAAGTIPARIWEGVSEGGVPVICFVTRIAVPAGADNSQFERELIEHAAPSAAARSFDLRFFVD
jgi:hypothetical protein